MTSDAPTECTNYVNPKDDSKHKSSQIFVRKLTLLKVLIFWTKVVSFYVTYNQTRIIFLMKFLYVYMIEFSAYITQNSLTTLFLKLNLQVFPE